MVELKKEKLLSIAGGASWYSASFLNAISRGITTLMDLGRSLGTSKKKHKWSNLFVLITKI